MEKQSFLLPFLAMVFVVLLIVSNISASNTFSVADIFSLSAAEFLLPLTYIVNNFITEFFGAKTANKIVAMGVGLMLFSAVFLFLSTLLPSNYVEYNTVFGQMSFGVVGITFASIFAILIGSFLNSFVFEKLKNKQNANSSSKFFVRIISSSIVANLCDTLVFITLCCLFAPQFYAWEKLLSFVLTISAIKILVEFLMFPVVNFLRKIVIKKNTDNNKK